VAPSVLGDDWRTVIPPETPLLDVRVFLRERDGKSWPYAYMKDRHRCFIGYRADDIMMNPPPQHSSPGETQMVFFGQLGLAGEHELTPTPYLLDIATGELQQLGVTEMQVVAWSPDGDKLALAPLFSSENKLIVHTISTGSQHEISLPDGHTYRWSSQYANGRWKSKLRASWQTDDTLWVDLRYMLADHPCPRPVARTQINVETGESIVENRSCDLPYPLFPSAPVFQNLEPPTGEMPYDAASTSHTS